MKRTQSDVLDAARAAAMHATLTRPGQTPACGSHLPPFWHYIYFWDALPPAQLGRDGHPKPGEFIPDTGLARRMWAGGELEFLAPIVLGQPASRQSTVASVTPKNGRTGPLCLVTITHEISQNNRVVLRERQDLIYREDPSPDAAKPATKPVRTDEDHAKTVHFKPTLLFRYSALTFNGHRIHYDRDYCRDVEGYPGLVVHGPLLAQMLIHLAEETLGTVTRFSFRATSPLFDFEAAELCQKQTPEGLNLWVRGPDGRQCMEAVAR